LPRLPIDREKTQAICPPRDSAIHLRVKTKDERMSENKYVAFRAIDGPVSEENL
jgi:hypothetical protein